MSSYLRPLYYAVTDPGRQRDHNEDTVHAGVIPGHGTAASPAYVFAVADGVGGLERGEWASRTAIGILNREVPAALGALSPTEALRSTFGSANTTVWQGGTSEVGSQRAATTLVAALVQNGTLWWAHVGDSRAYLVRQGRAQRLTQDHSWVDEQVRAGFMSREQALISERRNAITRSIGYDRTVEVDTGGPIPLRSGDVVIVCSDGLHGQITDDELAGIVQQLLPEAATERLVALSNERGGPDNISVIVCVMFDASTGDPAQERRAMAAQATLP